MKWMIGLLVALNVFAGLYAVVKQKPAADIRGRDLNAQQLKLLPPDWQPPQATSAPLASAPEASAPAMHLPATASQPAANLPPVPKLKPTVASVPHAEVPKPTPASKPVAPLATVTAKSEPAKPEPTQCLAWRGLDPAQLERVQGGLPSLKLPQAPVASVQEETRGSGKVWVFYPPLATRAETQTLVGELKSKGFDSYVVQTDGEFRGHLSLGLFGREDAARQLVGKLKAAGYDKAKVAVRGESVKVTALTFKGLDTDTAARLRQLQQRLYPGKPLAGC